MEPFHLAEDKVRELDKIVLRESKEFGMEAIPAFVVEGLGAAGQRFATDAWREFENWSGAESVLLRQAARALDDAETTSDIRGRRLSVRLFAALCQQLRLGQR